MTGEITLQGKVLKIGGLKSKILAAHRADISTVIIPRENEKDLDEIPEKVRDELKIILVDNVMDVLKVALIEDESKQPDKTLIPVQSGEDL